jgi:ADP-ribose pyrophosphatase YjhB (NUDIX family)
MVEHAFTDESLEAALDRALESATHLEAVHAATVRAARDLARKIDAWSVIVDWALEDAAESNGRPAVPANDNVSLASFLKYMAELGLTPQVAPKAAGKGAPAGAGGDEPEDEMAKMRARLAGAA